MAEKLYEMLWTSIRRGRWHDALNNVEVFLLAFPNHRYTAQLTLLKGHLHYQERDWEDALGAYDVLVKRYAPVRDRFVALSNTIAPPEREMRQVVQGAVNASDLPAFAVSMLRSDAQTKRAITVFEQLEEGERHVEASQRIIADLRGFLSGAAGAATMERMRLEVAERQLRAVVDQLELLDAQDRWFESAARPAPAGVAAVRPRRTEVGEASQALASDLKAANASLDAYEIELAQLRTQAGDSRATVDGLRHTIEEIRDGLHEGAGDEEHVVRALAEVEERERALQAARQRAADLDREMAALILPEAVPISFFERLDATWTEASKLAKAYRSARAGLADNDGAVVLAERVDAAEILLGDSFNRLVSVRALLSETQGTELEQLQERFEHEVDAVAKQSEDLDRAKDRATKVAHKLTRGGFDRLQGEFSDSVLKANMGIVDVFWAERVQRADALDGIRQAKDEQASALDARFRLIREQIGVER